MPIIPPADVTGLILAGGASRRFGRDKASEPAGEGTFLEAVAAALAPNVARILVSISTDGPALALARTHGPAWLLVRDLRPGTGPLAGLEAGFAAAETPVVFVAACDYPLLGSGDVALLLSALGASPGAAVAMPVVEGRAHPLCAAWRRDEAAPALAVWLESGRREATEFARSLRAIEVPIEAGGARAFTNVNRPDDLGRIERTVR